MLVRMGGGIAKFFVIDPLLGFLKGLESIFKILTAIAGVVGAVAINIGRVFGADLGAGFRGGGRLDNRRQVTLNQTGTESAEGTFARFQEAALKLGITEKMTPQEQHLRNIDKATAFIVAYINGLKKAAEEMTPEAMARGAGNAGLGMADFIFRQFGLPGLPGVR